MTKKRRPQIWETEGILYLSHRVNTELGSCQPSLNSLHSPLKGDCSRFLAVALIWHWPKATSGRRGVLCLTRPSYKPSVKELKAGSLGRHLKTGLLCCSHQDRCVEQACGTGLLVCMWTCTWRPEVNLGHHHVPFTFFLLLLRQVSQWPGAYNAGWPQAPEIRLPLPTTEIRSTHQHTWL